MFHIYVRIYIADMHVGDSICPRVYETIGGAKRAAKQLFTDGEHIKREWEVREIGTVNQV